jgi:hypothetical protein
MIPHNIRNTYIIPDIIRYQEYVEIVPDIAQTTYGIRNIFADIRNIPTAVFELLRSHLRSKRLQLMLVVLFAMFEGRIP